MFQTRVIEKIRTHFVFSEYFPKILPFMREWKKHQIHCCFQLQQWSQECALPILFITTVNLRDSVTKGSTYEMLVRKFETVKCGFI